MPSARPLTLAVPKGRILQPLAALLSKAGLSSEPLLSEDRRLVRHSSDGTLTFVFLKPTDVPTYVRHGAADLGVVGKDVLLEHGADGLYEPLDLEIARCRLVTAGRVGWTGAGGRIRVATKFVNIARQHFARQGVQVDIIRLYGALELAPIMGLADRIVDIVDTGNTLRANGLEPLEEIAAVSSRLVVNKAALRSRYTSITGIIEALAAVVRERGDAAA